MRAQIQVRRAIATGAAIASAVLASSTAAASAATPSLRLIAADSNVAVNRFEPTNVGLWVAATDGDFRMSMRRPDYGAWHGAQVDLATGEVLRTVPDDLIAGSSGFKRFVVLTFRDARGRVVARRAVDFCAGRAERVSDAGPQRPSYLGFCDPSFPFALGTVWGIDAGWASALSEFGAGLQRPLRVRPGRYRVHAQIRAPFRELFAIAAEDAEANLRVRVEREIDLPHGHEPPPSSVRLRARAAAAAVPTVENPDAATLPDLVALPPWSAYVERRGRRREELRFAGTPWNAGPAPLQVEGFRRPGQDVMDAYQYFIDASGAVAGRDGVGTMAFHSGGGHDHWHFLQFVAYRMLTRSGRTVVRARKQAFCLAPTNSVDLTVPRARVVPDVLGLESSACGDGRSIWIRETLPAGWGDNYSPEVAGQSFDITGVPNGRYQLEMQVNPLGALHEASTANNVARRAIVLTGKRGQRRVRMLPWHGIRD
jgi:hypothetical protein